MSPSWWGAMTAQRLPFQAAQGRFCFDPPWHSVSEKCVFGQRKR